MLFPKFIKKGQTIGICAPSAGVGHKINDYLTSIEYLKKVGFHLLETKSVRLDALTGGSKEERGKEFNELVCNDAVNMIGIAAGGDFLYDCLPYVDFKAILEHPKWVMGMSDPTSILYTITTKYDVATIYGMNVGQYDQHQLDCVQDNLEIIQGRKTTQQQYPHYLSKPTFEVDEIIYDKPTEYLSNCPKINVSGRCIGGCIDVLKDIIGTPYDGTKEYIERYQEDGLIWYFDNYSLSSENLYRTLLQFRYAGWFHNTKAILIGRTCIENTDTGLDYQDGIFKALDGIPVISQVDVGHTYPHFTMINGALMSLTYENQDLKFTFEYK